MTALVDWDLAERTGSRLVRGGPDLPPAEARAAVVELRRAAVEARSHVRAFTGLDAAAAGAPVEVVDRPSWVRANVAGFRALVEPVEAQLLHGRVPSGAVAAVGGGVTAMELGAVLAWLSSKVLGQFEVFASGNDQPGRLLLV
ncbi:MAG TPA: zinc-dependent metalloprotease, partial [Candidatus Limnocylindria bacterium]|nr:zinc-dependent metalloprotease [Candidatus Limnocylindria bacterium]